MIIESTEKKRAKRIFILRVVYSIGVIRNTDDGWLKVLGKQSKGSYRIYNRNS